ncbi:MAG TPA: hypothetical protein DD618_01200 [Acholeplasmatales bacterium]|nr:hypothetical protein [Acholeplasmatales bacterium]
MQTFMRISSLFPVVLSLLWVVKSAIEAKTNEEQRAFPWYRKTVFWVSIFFIVTLLYALFFWNIEY